MLKKIIALVLITVIISSFYINVSAATVSVDGNCVELESVSVDGSVLVPLRDIFELLGAEVGWNAESRTGTASVGDFRVFAAVGERFIVVNGKRREMPLETQIISDKIYIPIRAAAEALNCTVGYDEATATVVITKGELPWTLGDIFRGIISIKGWEHMQIAMQIGDSININGIDCALITAYSDNGAIGNFAVSYDLAYVYEQTIEGSINLKLSR